MYVGYSQLYLAAITVQPDGESRLKSERINRERKSSKSDRREPLARTRKSRKSLKDLLERRVDKIKRFTKHARNTIQRAATAIEKTY